MQLPSHSFDPETVALIGHVCDMAREEAQTRLSFPQSGDTSQLRSLVVSRVMAAVIVEAAQSAYKR